MDILITGGCGLVGSNLIKYYNKKKIYNIIVVDNLSIGKKKYLKKLKYKKFLNLDLAKVKQIEILKKYRISLIIHLAAKGSVIESIQKPIDNFNNNVRSTLNLLNFAKQTNVKKFVFSSTGGAIIGDGKLPVNEQSLPRPLSPYGASKLSCEGYCSAYSKAYNINVTILRFANVIGMNSDHKKGVINKFLNNIKKNKPLIIFGQNKISRDFIDVDDICVGIYKSSKYFEEKFSLFHLCSGKETKIKDLAILILKILKLKNYQIKFSEMRAGEVQNNFGTYQLAHSVLKFSPKKNIKQSLNKILLNDKKKIN